MSRYIICIHTYVCTNKKLTMNMRQTTKIHSKNATNELSLRRYRHGFTYIHMLLRHCDNEEGVHLCLHMKSHPFKKNASTFHYTYTHKMFTQTQTEYNEKPHTLTHLKQRLIHNSANIFRSEQSA